MVQTYAQLLSNARKEHTPSLSAKELADALEVKPPFITDIEKGRRLPSLDTQKKIKNLLACDKYPTHLFDDLAAADNSDCRIVAEDLSKAIRSNPALRTLIRTITSNQLSTTEIESLTAYIGGIRHDIK